MEYAPIVLFTYNRPVHTKKVLDALAANPEAKHSLLYVYCDGAKENTTQEGFKQIDSVRSLVKVEKRFNEIEVIIQNQNKGLANSIIDGVTEILSKHDKIIVLEDDLLPSVGFLAYMNFSLEHFKNETKVGSINSYINKIPNLPDYYFLEGGDCWGWGTWNRAWKHLNTDTVYLYKQLVEKQLIGDWDYGGMKNIIENAISNPKNIWHIRWHTSLYLNGMLGLWPNQSFIYNMGLDASGTNVNTIDNMIQFAVNDLRQNVNTSFISKMSVEENKGIKKKVQQFYLQSKHYPKLTLFERMFNKLSQFHFKRLSFGTY